MTLTILSLLIHKNGIYFHLLISLISLELLYSISVYVCDLKIKKSILKTLYIIYSRFNLEINTY